MKCLSSWAFLDAPWNGRSNIASEIFLRLFVFTLFARNEKSEMSEQDSGEFLPLIQEIFYS